MYCVRILGVSTCTSRHNYNADSEPHPRPPGHKVEFQNGPASFITGSGDTLVSADTMFALAIGNPNVLADSSDTGVAVINYVDAGGGNVFPSPRDVGIPPLSS